MTNIRVFWHCSLAGCLIVHLLIEMVESIDSTSAILSIQYSLLFYACMPHDRSILITQHSLHMPTAMSTSGTSMTSNRSMIKQPCCSSFIWSVNRDRSINTCNNHMSVFSGNRLIHQSVRIVLDDFFCPYCLSMTNSKHCFKSHHQAGLSNSPIFDAQQLTSDPSYPKFWFRI